MQISRDVVKESLPGLFLALILGIICVFLAGSISHFIEGANPIAARLLVGFSDALLLGLIVGIVIRSIVGFRIKILTAGFLLAPTVFIPIGAIFYGARNLNFVKFGGVVQAYPFAAILAILFMIIYVGVIYLLSRLLEIDKKTCYLTATGSAICGASAIAITSQAVEAEPRHVSTALLSVFLAALIGITIIYPQLARATGMDAEQYGLFSATILQFTGFVKAAVGAGAPPELKPDIKAQNIKEDVALPVKAFRYLGLLVLIPLFATLIKGKPYVPWYLWGFLLAGLLLSALYAAGSPLYKPLHRISGILVKYLWTTVMVAIGLQIDIRDILNMEFLKTFLTAFAAFIINICVFILCLHAGLL